VRQTNGSFCPPSICSHLGEELQRQKHRRRLWKHFAVDWVCAFRELEILGVKIDAAYKGQILKSVEGHIAAPQRRKSRQVETLESSLDHDENFAYIAGYTEAGFAYGITWEEWGRLKQKNLLDREGDSSTNFSDETPELPF